MKKVLACAMLVLGMMAVSTPVRAQEAEANDKFSFGKVVSVAADQLTVKEYDFAKDADVEMTYTVTSETEFGNVSAVTELAANDDIVIDYVEKDGKRVVTTLVKEEKGAEAPMAPAAEGDDTVTAPENDAAVPAEAAQVPEAADAAAATEGEAAPAPAQAEAPAQN